MTSEKFANVSVKVSAFVFVFIFVAEAECSDQLKSIIRSSSSEQLTQYVATQEEEAVIKVACEIELRDQRIPVSCFKQSIEDSKGLRHLEEICAKRAASAHSLRELSEVDVSNEKCRAAIDRRKADLIYKAEESDPASLIK